MTALLPVFAPAARLAEAAELVGLVRGSDAVADRRLLAQVPELKLAVWRLTLAREMAGELAKLAAELTEATQAQVEAAAAHARARAAMVEAGPLAEIPGGQARALARAAQEAARQVERSRAALGPRPRDEVEAEAERAQALEEEAAAGVALAEAEAGERVLRSRLAGGSVSACGVVLTLAGGGVVPLAVAGAIPVCAAVVMGAVWRYRGPVRAAELQLMAAQQSLAELDARKEDLDRAEAGWRQRQVAAVAAETQMAAAGRAWEAVAGPGTDPARVDELLAQASAARRGAAQLATARTLYHQAQARLSETRRRWDGLMTRLDLSPGCSPAEAQDALAARTATGAAAETVLADVEQARARVEARRRLADLLGSGPMGPSGR